MTSFLPVAIKTMNKVASHINEMQKIHEEFGAVFDQLIAEQTGEKKEVRTPPSCQHTYPQSWVGLFLFKVLFVSKIVTRIVFLLVKPFFKLKYN